MWNSPVVVGYNHTSLAPPGASGIGHKEATSPWYHLAHATL